MRLPKPEHLWLIALLGRSEAKYLNPNAALHAGGLTTPLRRILGAEAQLLSSRRSIPICTWKAGTVNVESHHHGHPTSCEQIEARSEFKTQSQYFNHIRHSHVAGATIVEHLLESWPPQDSLFSSSMAGPEMGPSAMAMPASRVLDNCRVHAAVR